jgi:uncharacterized membrane protein
MTRQDSDSHVYTVLAFCFVDRSTAGEVLKELKTAKKLEEYHIVAEAVVEVDDKGKSHVHQHGRGGVGAAAGIMAGEALALLGGPVGLLAFAAAGGVIGGAAGHFVDQAFSKEELAKLKDQLPPNSSALLTMAKEAETEKITTGLQNYGAAVVTLALGAEASSSVAEAVAAAAQNPSAAERSEQG